MAGGGGSSPHVVAVKLSAASQAAVSDSWTDSKLLSGDVVLQVSTDSGAVFRAPFAGGKAGLQREFRKLTNARGGLKVKVKRGQTILDVWVKVALDESSLLKKNYVLVSLHDATHVATLVDAIEQECIDLQDKSRKILEATRLPQEYSKKDELLLRMNSMRLAESYVAYPWEQKMQTYLPVSGSATVFSLLVMPVALSPKSREYADVEDTSARAVAWLSAAQASGVPISCVNIQTEPLFLQFVEYRHPGYRQDPANIANSGCYRLQVRNTCSTFVWDFCKFVY
jgi:hypothetical protein